MDTDYQTLLCDDAFLVDLGRDVWLMDTQLTWALACERLSCYPDPKFDDVEAELGRDWGTARGRSSLEWERAKHATRDA
ncbi:hypothetical protein QTI24_29630 [Variovorax sp. J22P240]|uniref:hypothetical protein n=1 Tax=Variovorax sp. J22P240 TaxID=3053514 RepID=UPI0025792229|nr:hypothetical protein [Variovorax sp. J22P240]MDM0002788.1 hypothetical protein [Variovorax sp. J22P240]